MGEGRIPCDMRGDNQARAVPERIVCRKRFGFEHIQAGIQPAFPQVFFQCFLVNDAAATDVNDSRMIRKKRQQFFGNQAECIWRAGKGNDQDIRSGQRLIQIPACNNPVEKAAGIAAAAIDSGDLLR